MPELPESWKAQLPSVTQILKACGLSADYTHVPKHLLDHAAQRGTALHLAIQLYHEDDLDEDSLHPEVAPGFSSYRKFLVESRHEPLHTEIEVIHPMWHYVGHPDRIGFLNEKRVILDFKYMETVKLAPAVLQMTAYKLAWEAMYPDSPLAGGYVLQLKRDGTYRLHHTPLDQKAEQTFLAALVVYRAIEENAR